MLADYAADAAHGCAELVHQMIDLNAIA